MENEIEEYKDKPTWLYYIFIPGMQIWKIGVALDELGGIKGKYQNETFAYYIISEELFQDGSEACKKKQEIIDSNTKDKWEPTEKQKFGVLS